MSTPGEESQREHPSTYFVQDRSNEEELKRLALQDHMVTTRIGGILPEQPETAHFQRVLDVGCGTGGWLIEVAKTHPEASLLIGVDVSGRMLDYAREQAKVQGVDKQKWRRLATLLRQAQRSQDQIGGKTDFIGLASNLILRSLSLPQECESALSFLPASIHHLVSQT